MPESPPCLKAEERWCGVVYAARYAGVTHGSIYKWLREGRLKQTGMVGGRRLVWLPEVVREARRKRRRETGPRPAMPAHRVPQRWADAREAAFLLGVRREAILRLIALDLVRHRKGRHTPTLVWLPEIWKRLYGNAKPAKPRPKSEDGEEPIRLGPSLADKLGLPPHPLFAAWRDLPPPEPSDPSR